MTTDSDVEVGREVLTFPPDFLWGAATAAFQIEGSTTVDGRGHIPPGHGLAAAQRP